MNIGLVKKIIGSVIAVLAGGVFIFSGATKLMPIEAFEISLVDVGFASWNVAPVISRLLIGLEFTIGFLLLFHFMLRKITVPVATVLLGIFTVYILYLLKTYGNRGSCGCFGTVIEFTPLEGLIKNFVLIAMLIIAYQWAFSFEFRFKTVIALVGAVIFFILPFVINPIGYPFGVQPMNEFKRFDIDTAVLYKDAANTNPVTDITKGKHLVTFLSAACPHCRLAAKKLVVYKKQTPDFPLIFVFYNNKEKLPDFFNDTKSEKIPRIMLETKEGFLQLTSGMFPRIFWVDNGTVVYETNYYQLNKNDIDLWLAGKEVP